MANNSQGPYILTLIETIQAIDLEKCKVSQLDALDELLASALNQVIEERNKR